MHDTGNEYDVDDGDEGDGDEGDGVDGDEVEGGGVEDDVVEEEAVESAELLEEVGGGSEMLRRSTRLRSQK